MGGPSMLGVVAAMPLGTEKIHPAICESHASYLADSPLPRQSPAHEENLDRINKIYRMTRGKEARTATQTQKGRSAFRNLDLVTQDSGPSCSGCLWLPVPCPSNKLHFCPFRVANACAMSSEKPACPTKPVRPFCKFVDLLRMNRQTKSGLPEFGGIKSRSVASWLVEVWFWIHLICTAKACVPICFSSCSPWLMRWTPKIGPVVKR